MTIQNKDLIKHTSTLILAMVGPYILISKTDAYLTGLVINLQSHSMLLREGITQKLIQFETGFQFTEIDL